MERLKSCTLKGGIEIINEPDSTPQEWTLFADLVQASGLSPQRLWKRFWALSPDAAWGYLWCSYDLEYLIPAGENDPPDFSQELYVPTRWVEEILELLMEGVVRVDIKFGLEPKNTIRSILKPNGQVMHIVKVY